MKNHNNPPFETVIPCAPIDVNKLPYVVDALFRHTETSAACIITPDPSQVPPLNNSKPVAIYADRDVLDFDRALFKHRPNWVFQQFLKLFQNVTLTDWYLVIDADLIFVADVSLFSAGKPIFLLGLDQYHEPYFCFNQRMFGFGKTYPYSFLSECTLYNKNIIRNMLQYGAYSSIPHFLTRATEMIDGGCYPAESEIYGSYVYLTEPDLYTFRHIRSALGGKYGNKPYTNEEIEVRIAEVNKVGGAHVLTIHSWEGAIE